MGILLKGIHAHIDPVTITDLEFDDLRNLLTLMREDEWLEQAISGIGALAKYINRHKLADLVHEVHNAWLNAGPREAQEGLLYSVGSVDRFEDIDKEEFEELIKVLAVLRSHLWLGPFITFLCKQEPPLTPTEVMDWLTQEQEEFETVLCNAAHMQRYFGRLLKPETESPEPTA